MSTPGEALEFVSKLTALAKSNGMTCLEVQVGDLKIEMHFKAPEPPPPPVVKP